MIGSATGKGPVMAIRNVVSVTKVGCGCTELELDCGHVQRRRLGLCPPTRVACPDCRRGAPTGSPARPVIPPQENRNAS